MKVKIKIIKDHSNGLKKGDVKTLSKKFADELIKIGLAEEVKTRKPSTKKEK